MSEHGGLRDVQLTLIDSLDDVLQFKEWLSQRRPNDTIGFDVESTGLDVHNDKVRLIQFGDATAGWAFARDDWQGIARAVIGEWRGRFVGHNASFDTSMLQHSCGINMPRDRIDDTLVMAAINEPHMSKALKSQAARHVDPAAAGLQVELGKATGWTWETVPIDYAPYWSYGALDPVLTVKLRDHHWPTVATTAPRAYDLEMATLWIIERAQNYGVCVDRERAEQKVKEFDAYCASVEQWCQSTYGVRPGSNQKIIEILERDGITFNKKTKSGALSLDSEVLEDIDHPLAQTVLNRRQIQKMASTYLAHYAHDADANGILYPTFNTLGARTGRMSSQNPNLQNLPRRGTSKAGDAVRDMVVSRHALKWFAENGVHSEDERDAVYSPTKHGALIFCDFSQIEMRLLAHMANETAMIEAFKSPMDFFINLARQVYQDDTIMKKDPRRQVTKNAGYATIYGAGIPKFAQTAGISVEAARTFMTRWSQLYPGVAGFQQSNISHAMESVRSGGPRGVRSPLTERWFICDEGKEYAATNYRIQGTAAELLKLKICELDAAGLGEYFMAPVHDEVILDVPGEHVRDVVRALRGVMNDDKLLSVPITAEVSYGRTWGRKFDWHDDL